MYEVAKCAELQSDSVSIPIDAVCVVANDQTYWGETDGSLRSSILLVQIPWGTQQIANNLFTKYKGVTYQGYTATNAIFPTNPEGYLEKVCIPDLGQDISVGVVCSKVLGFSMTASPLLSCDVYAPSNNS